MKPERVVTLPPGKAGAAAVAFAHEAKRAGATLLELRTDLQDASVDAAELARVLPLVVSERGKPLQPEWCRAARFVDRDITASARGEHPTTLPSHHATRPLRPEEALALWSGVDVADGACVKHVEPLGEVRDARRLLDTQRLLGERFGAHRVTVLGMGPAALPFRAVLAQKNRLDYLALSPSFRAAPGQRLLADAVREDRAAPGRLRLGILGARIDGSRSPRIHRQPFDRVDLPEDAPIAELLEALHPFYLGFSVTSPFKKAAARAVGATLDAVNTLVRRESGGFSSANTDVDGARAVLERMGAREVTVLGDGGVTTALRLAAPPLKIRLTVLRRADVSAAPVSGACVWTWPKDVPPPEPLRFRDADVAVVAYGAPARQIASVIRERGGRPRLFGAKWFVAQARRQRELWEST